MIRKLLAAFFCLLMAVSAFMAGTNAWQSLNQHKTNDIDGGQLSVTTTKETTVKTETTTTTAHTTKPSRPPPDSTTAPNKTTPSSATAPSSATTNFPKTQITEATEPTHTATVTVPDKVVPEPPTLGNGAPVTGEPSTLIWFGLMLSAAFAAKILIFGRKKRS